MACKDIPSCRSCFGLHRLKFDFEGRQRRFFGRKVGTNVYGIPESMHLSASTLAYCVTRWHLFSCTALIGSTGPVSSTHRRIDVIISHAVDSGWHRTVLWRRRLLDRNCRRPTRRSRSRTRPAHASHREAHPFQGRLEEAALPWTAHRTDELFSRSGAACQASRIPSHRSHRAPDPRIDRRTAFEKAGTHEASRHGAERGAGTHRTLLSSSLEFLLRSVPVIRGRFIREQRRIPTACTHRFRQPSFRADRIQKHSRLRGRPADRYTSSLSFFCFRR